MISRRAFVSLPLLVTNRVRPTEYLSINLITQKQRVQWDDPESAVSMGSLLKPFLVIAYSRTHTRFPVLTCRGTADHCWLPRGHGRQDIIGAIAHSCNFYFRELSAGLNPAALEAVCVSYGLNMTKSVLPDDLIGLGTGWPQRPSRVLLAFAALPGNRSQASVSIALAGMRAAADHGTARGLGISACAKTGTAPCSHIPKAEGDGFVAALYPCDQPRIVFLARQHGTTGAATATLAGPILRTLI